MEPGAGRGRGRGAGAGAGHGAGAAGEEVEVGPRRSNRRRKIPWPLVSEYVTEFILSNIPPPSPPRRENVAIVDGVDNAVAGVNNIDENIVAAIVDNAAGPVAAVAGVNNMNVAAIVDNAAGPVAGGVDNIIDAVAGVKNLNKID